MKDYSSRQAMIGQASAFGDGIPEAMVRWVETPADTKSEPRQLGRIHLTPEERQKRMTTGECLYCGQKGDCVNSCFWHPKNLARQ